MELLTRDPVTRPTLGTYKDSYALQSTRYVHNGLQYVWSPDRIAVRSLREHAV